MVLDGHTPASNLKVVGEWHDFNFNLKTGFDALILVQVFPIDSWNPALFLP